MRLHDAIEKEYQNVLPFRFDSRVRKVVLSTITKSTHKAEPYGKDDILLFSTVLIFSCLIYFFGFDSEFKLSVDISKDLQKNLGIGVSILAILIYLAINEFFERKKIFHSI